MAQRMFVFPFGDGDYDKQSAVVLAETREEALTLLLADIEQNQKLCPHGTPGESHGCYDVEWPNGFEHFYFTPERLEEAARAASEGSDMAEWNPTGSVAYIYGMDG